MHQLSILIKKNLIVIIHNILPHTGEFMIRCDECKEWYHGDCVRTTQEEAKALGNFVCSGCHRHPREKV
jgi:MinD superfamily P-loop ATPase